MLASRAVGGAHGEATQNKRIEKEDWAGGGKKIKGVHFSLVTHTPMIQRTTLTDTLKGTEPQSTKQR